jgi:hypothetical protein
MADTNEIKVDSSKHRSKYVTIGVGLGLVGLLAITSSCPTRNNQNERRDDAYRAGMAERYAPPPPYRDMRREHLGPELQKFIEYRRMLHEGKELKPEEKKEYDALKVKFPPLPKRKPGMPMMRGEEGSMPKPPYFTPNDRDMHPRLNLGQRPRNLDEVVNNLREKYGESAVTGFQALMEQYDDKENGLFKTYSPGSDRRQLHEELSKLRVERFKKIDEYMKGLENQPVKK